MFLPWKDSIKILIMLSKFIKTFYKPLTALQCGMFSKMKQIHQKLIINNHKYNTPTIIRVMHKVKFSSEQHLLTSSQFQLLLQRISIHQLDHESITLFLQVLKKFPSYGQFNRSSQVYKNVFKRLNSIRVLKLNPEYIFRLLFVLEELNFPPFIFLKYVQFLVQEYFSPQKSINSGKKINSLDTLRIYLLILEKKQIPLQILCQITKCLFGQHRYENLIEMAYLYHIHKSLHKITKKMQYFMEKKTAYDIMLNPYQNQGEEELKTSMKELMQQLKAEILETWNSKINEQTLKNSILKKVYEQGLSVSVCRLIGDIPQLLEEVRQFLEENLQKMMPLQFLNILQHIKQSERFPFYELYKLKNFESMNIMERVALIEGRQRLCNMRVQVKDIHEILQSVQALSSMELQVLCGLALRRLSEEDQGQVLIRLNEIVDRMQ